MRAARPVIWHDPPMLTPSQDQINQIPKWLKHHQFKLDKVETKRSGKRTWARGRCQVRIGKYGDYDVAEIYTRDRLWVELGKYISGFEKGPNSLFHAPIEMAISRVLDIEVSKTPSLGARLYSLFSPGAYFAKVALQMLIGLGTVVALCLVLSATFSHHYRHVEHFYTHAGHTSILVITAGLAAAAAVELAYTLFTPGPDEALDPLMLGLSAGILLLVTRDGIRVGWQFLGIIVGVIALGALFHIRRRYIDSEES